MPMALDTAVGDADVELTSRVTIFAFRLCLGCKATDARARARVCTRVRARAHTRVCVYVRACMRARARAHAPAVCRQALDLTDLHPLDMRHAPLESSHRGTSTWRRPPLYGGRGMPYGAQQTDLPGTSRFPIPTLRSPERGPVRSAVCRRRTCRSGYDGHPTGHLSENSSTRRVFKCLHIGAGRRGSPTARSSM